MALRRINPTKKPLLHLPRPFSSSFSSNPHPPPPPPSDDPDASPRSPPPAPQNNGDLPQRPTLSSLFLRPTGQAAGPSMSIDNKKRILESFHASISSPPSFRDPSFQDQIRKRAARLQGGPIAGEDKPFDKYYVDFKTLVECTRKIDPAPYLPRKPQQPGSGKEEAEDATYEELRKKFDDLRSSMRNTTNFTKKANTIDQIMRAIKKNNEKKAIKSLGSLRPYDITGQPIPEDQQHHPPQEELLERKEQANREELKLAK